MAVDVMGSEETGKWDLATGASEDVSHKYPTSVFPPACLNKQSVVQYHLGSA